MFYEYGTRNWQTGAAAPSRANNINDADPAISAGGNGASVATRLRSAGAGGNGQISFASTSGTIEWPSRPGHRPTAPRSIASASGTCRRRVTPELYLDDLVVDGKRIRSMPIPLGKAAATRWNLPTRDPAHITTLASAHAALRRPPRARSAASSFATNGPLTTRADRRRSRSTTSSWPVASWCWPRRAATAACISVGSTPTTKQANETPEHVRRQSNVLGIVLEGPSRVGHYFRPGYSNRAGAGLTADGSEGWPVIRPDGQPHSWRLHYRPGSGPGAADRLSCRSTESAGRLDLAPTRRASGAHASTASASSICNRAAITSNCISTT